jgi:DNA invertase Pin-like site-specific DNA recombinase
MGRLTPNVLLSFAQFEREVIGERIRDKGRRIQAQRNLARWFGATRIRDPGAQIAHQFRGSTNRKADIRALSRTGTVRKLMKDLS